MVKVGDYVYTDYGVMGVVSWIDEKGESCRVKGNGISMIVMVGELKKLKKPKNKLLMG